MSMLAEPRRKQRIGPNPRGKFFTEDDDNRGRQMLMKMGWKNGDGLGATSQGMSEPIKPKVNTESRGLGFDKKQDPWVAHNEEFEQLLRSLNSGASDSDSNNRNRNSTAKTDGGDSSDSNNEGLEKKSKSSRSRIHYHKFVKNKDLSRASVKDISCIFGKSVEKLGESDTLAALAINNVVPADTERMTEKSPEDELGDGWSESNDVVIKKKKKKRNKNRDEETVVEHVEEEEAQTKSTEYVDCQNAEEVLLETSNEKRKKKKKRKDKENENGFIVSEENINVIASNGLEDQVQPTNEEDLSNETSLKKKKKKSKRRKDEEDACIHEIIGDGDAEIQNTTEEITMQEVTRSKKKKSKKRKLSTEEKEIEINSNDFADTGTTESELYPNAPEEVTVVDEESKPKKKKKKSKKHKSSEDDTPPSPSPDKLDCCEGEPKITTESEKPDTETFGSMQFINRGSIEDYFRNKRLQMLNRKLSK